MDTVFNKLEFCALKYTLIYSHYLWKIITTNIINVPRKSIQAIYVWHKTDA